jgi:SAM-dependent methyltransferase
MEARSIVEQPDRQAASGRDADELRARLHGMWAAVAGSWGEHAEYADARGAAVTERMLAASRPQPGERVLELACGPGGVGIAAARLVAPGGEVVLSDVVAEMTAIAAARAAAAGADNVQARVLDIESIDEPDASYDVVLCREGLMFAPDPARAASEIRRVLRPGGRVAIAVWGPRERNPWLGLVFDAVSAQTGRPVPPPGVPGPFSLGDSATVVALLADAGLAGVQISELPTPLRAGTFEEWWTRTSALAGPLAKILAALPEGAAQALRERLRDVVRPYTTPSGLEIPGLTLIASARQ